MGNIYELLTTIFAGVTALSIVVAVIQLFININHNQRNKRQNSAEQMLHLHEKFMHDEGCRNLFYEIDYGHFEYNSDTHETQQEKELDIMLDYLTYVCRLYREGLINLLDLRFFEYEILRVYRNRDVKKYLDWVRFWCAQNHCQNKYADLVEVGEELEMNSK